VGRGLLLLALAATAWVGWRAYDHRAAIREAEVAGFEWKVREPIALIRADWRAAFQKETWTGSYWSLDVGAGRELASLRPLLLRLRPTALTAPACQDANLDALKGLSGLKGLDLSGCTALQNVDALKGLSGLKYLYLSGCTALQNVDALEGLAGLQYLDLSGCTALQNADALKGLSGLQHLRLSGCTALQNVDALKGLTGLQRLDLTACPKLPAAAVAELRAALPKTAIYFDHGR
jgi:internalin A